MKKLLSILKKNNISVTLNNGDLKVKFNGDKIPDEIVVELKARKKELVEYLSGLKKLGSEITIDLLPPQDNYVLSSSQLRIWVLSQFEDANLAYNMPAVYVFEGKLDIDCLQRAFLVLIGRHEILRTVFKEDKQGEVRQYIRSVAEIGFNMLQKDLSEKADREQLLVKDVEAMHERPFDLAEGPLLRAELFRLEPQKWVLSFSMHHIISDGWSLGLLIKELLTVYNAFVNGESNPLSPLRIQYKEYAAWQQQQLGNEHHETHKNYWLQQLSGTLPVLELLTDMPRPAIKTYSGGVVGKTISKETTDGIKVLGQQHGATLFMELMAAVNLLLHLYTGQEDLILGSPIAGREHSDLEEQIGLYLNTIVLRTRFKKEESFTSLVENVRSVTLGAYEHQVYPFDELVENLELKRDMSRTPLFDVLIVLQNTGMNRGRESQQLGDVLVRSYDQGELSVSKFDLSFTFTEVDNELQLGIEYNSDLYCKPTIERMAQHLETILQVVISEPEKPLQHIKLLTENEKKRMFYDFNNTEFDYPKNKTYVELFEEQVRKDPSRIALITNDEKISYGEINQKANKLAYYLRVNYTVQPDDIVALKIERNEWMLISILGILKSGAAYVPVDPAYPADRISYILDDSKCKLMIDELELEKFIADQDNYSASDPSPVNKPEHLMYVLYTSGSTGHPKGVMLEHRNVVACFENLKHRFGITEKSVFGSATNYTFDISVLELLGTLSLGAKVALINTLDASEIFELIKNHKIDVLQLTPSRLNLLLEVDKKQNMLHTLKTILVGGEALMVQQYEYLKGLVTTRTFNGYGPTETAIYSTALEIGNSVRVSIGRPLLNETVLILDNQLCIQPIGLPGEICIAGAGVARGYLNKPDLTAEKFIPHPFQENERLYKTGDIGRWLPDGTIEYIGRIDQQVKLRGYRIEPGEIENVLQLHPSVLSAVVAVKEDASGEKILAAYIVADQEPDLASLKRFLSTKVPAFMLPDVFVVLDKMPLNASGKIDRKSLPDVKVSGTVIKKEYLAPRNETEQKLAQIWEQLLNIEKAGIKDDFFDLGGHSLKATRLVNSLQREFGLKVSLKDIFENSVLEELAAFIGIKQWRLNDQSAQLNVAEEGNTEIHTF